jgi:signal transduction histidine kinase/CheY-like chemotaxis protein
MPWFALIPIASLYLLEIRSAVIWLVVCLLVDVFMACVTSAGWLLESPAITGPSWIWHTVNFLHLSVLMPYLPLHYKFLQSRTMQKIRDQNASMSEAKNALLREKARMEEFIASVSHEFRTPMNAIMGFTELLEEHIQGSPSALEMHGHMTQSAKHLLTVIDDILDYSQLQKGQLTIRRETFELGKVCESAHTMFKPRVQARHIDYRLQMDVRPMWVEGDSHRLMQLLVNLLGNAVKFTDKGLITLTVSNQDGGVLFEVRDTGIGIAPERVGQLFQHFEQVHALLPGRYEGNGLGLAISKRLIELQGGRISVSSALGVGSVFSMWLPLTAVAAPAHELQTGKSTTTSTEELKVLVVDDHPLNRLLVSQIIQKNWPQAQLVEAEDGGQAVEIMQERTFHVVLMDMVMPVMDGIEATRHIRQNMSAPACDTPILGLTANVNPIDKQRCIEAGMKEVLYKPLNKEVLIHHIEAILRRA